MVTLNHICGVDKFANLRWVLEKGREFPPIVAPRADNKRILDAPDFLEAVQFKQRPFLSCSFVNRLQVSGDFLEILVRQLTGGVADLVNDALLNLGLWIAGRNRFGGPLRLSTQIMRMSWTPRFRRSSRTLSQNLLDSFSPIHIPSTSLFPSRSMPITM